MGNNNHCKLKLRKLLLLESVEQRSRIIDVLYNAHNNSIFSLFQVGMHSMQGCNSSEIDIGSVCLHSRICNLDYIICHNMLWLTNN